jgi:hypothetical protein
VNTTPRNPWFWRITIIAAVILALDCLVDLKYWLSIICVLWIAAAVLCLYRIKKDQRANQR